MDRETLSKNRAVLAGLAALVLVVWGLVGYRAWTATQQATVPPAADTAIEVSEPRERQPYQDDYRDPFQPLVALAAPRASAPSRRTSPLVDSRALPWESDDEDWEGDAWDEEVPDSLPQEPPSPDPPEWILRGTVGQAALVESSGGTSWLVREGDVVEGFRITRIQPQFITVETEGDYFLLFLE